MNKEIAKILLDREISETKADIRSEKVFSIVTETLMTVTCGSGLGPAFTIVPLIKGSIIPTVIASVGFGAVGFLVAEMILNKEDTEDRKVDLKLLKDLRNSLEQSKDNVFENIEEENFSQALGTYGHSKYRKMSN